MRAFSSESRVLSFEQRLVSPSLNPSNQTATFSMPNPWILDNPAPKVRHQNSPVQTERAQASERAGLGRGPRSEESKERGPALISRIRTDERPRR